MRLVLQVRGMRLAFRQRQETSSCRRNNHPLRVPVPAGVLHFFIIR